MPEDPPTISQPHELFAVDPNELWMHTLPLLGYDIARDGHHFYSGQPVRWLTVPAVTHIDLVQNWFEELKARVRRPASLKIQRRGLAAARRAEPAESFEKA